MDTQNTPVHVRLWHKDFWFLSIANLLLCMSVYMMVPVLPSWLYSIGFSHFGVAAVMGVFGLSMLLFGPFCNYWVQHYRRNHVCRMAIILMLVSYIGFYTLGQSSVAFFFGADTMLAIIWGLRIILGAAFGLSQMVLCSTLIIDSCESFQRTEANYAVAWFGRFALSLGPLSALVCQQLITTETMFLVMGAFSFVAILLIQMIGFPFRAPEENQRVVSLDRFFLPESWPLFLHLMLMTVIVGLLLSVPHNVAFYSMIMVGFFFALLAEKFVFADADLKSEVISGLILVGVSFFMMHRMFVSGTPLSELVPPVLFGLGIGVIGSRFLLFFIKLSRHCQRGTSQSSFLLAWELGVCLGLYVGYALFQTGPTGLRTLYQVGLVLTLANLLIYHLLTHRWYLNHKNR